ncbi:MAG: insulinase family protein [Planctomycetes bacterium]|nr:insulinase family protein [Planctomycetota bacterium]
MLKLKRFALIALIAASVLFAGAGCRKKPSAVDTDSQKYGTKLFDYKQIELENGMKVITLEDFSTPIVAAQVWYHVGSKDEQPDRQGFAHMFEHMMFKGTDRVAPPDHFKFIQSVGGSNNAYTSFDATVYIQTLPANQLELALWLEAERMTFLKIDQKAFDTERNVVEEELRKGENRPYGTLFKKTFAALFTKHPYQWTPIGKMAHLRASSVEELRKFWKKYYVPGNATLVIVGAVKHADAQEMAKKYFSWIPKYDKPGRVTIREPEPKEPRTLVIDDENAPAPLVSLLWTTVPLGHKDEPVLNLLGSILGDGNSSRLYRDLVAENQLAVAADAYAYNMEDEGLFSVDATLPQGSDKAEEIVESMKNHIAKIISDGVTKAELDKVRNKMLKRIVTKNLTIGSKAQLLGNAAVRMGDVSRVNTRLADIIAVTAEDIQRAAVEYLTAKRMLTVFVKENTAGASAASKDVAKEGVTAKPELTAPKPGREGSVRPDDFPKQAPFAKLESYKASAKFTSTELTNGLKVIVVENHEVPFVSIKLGLTGGAWTEAKPGTAAMTLSMLTKGTENYTEGQLAEKLESNAISLRPNAGMDTSVIQSGCLTVKMPLAMELMAEVVLRPVFDETEFAKLRKQVVTGLSIEEKSPRYLAGKELRKRLYGKHPYARTVEGEIKDVMALTVDDLKQWWSRWSLPDMATLIFAGDITTDEAVIIAKKTFGKWKAESERDPIVIRAIDKIGKTKIYIVDTPGSEQSEIRVGTSGIVRADQPDYFTSRVVGNYFGGSFNSRLNETIRVKKGLTYGARGGWRAQKMAGSFTVSTFTKNASTAETVKAIFDEIKRLQNEPPAEKILTDTKNYFAGSFVRTRETPQSVAEDLWLIESQNLKPDYLDRLLESIANTTANQCTDLAKRTIDPDKMVVVVVGDAKKIKRDLIRIAPVEVIIYSN